MSWIVHELSRASTVLADRAVSHALATRGFTTVEPADAAGRTVQFVVSTAALRSAAAHTAAVADALESSIPVAVVGSGADEVSVRQVADVSAAELTADARTRRSAERELLANPAISASNAAARQLRQGAMDLRCAAFLAIAAATDPVRLVRLNVDPAERAAGRPARSIDVRTSSLGHLRALMRDATSVYRVASSVPLPGGSVRLTWPVDAQPLSSS